VKLHGTISQKAVIFKFCMTWLLDRDLPLSKNKATEERGKLSNTNKFYIIKNNFIWGLEKETT
jgi:hypothetical protein